ncbi:MAG TPA: UbiA family prenyltransferase [Gemmatimonadaceae bacterium]|nr:UbiA family prenyltransferase [Gemmatimonadaceae bacterium]
MSAPLPDASGQVAAPGDERTAAAPAWRTLNAARRAGYRLLPGDAFSYVLHLRPREWPIMVGHMTLGYLLARGWSAAALRGVGPFLAALFIVVVLENGGTLAINSAFDRDAGDVGYLDAPPPVPRHLAAFSVAIMLAGLVAAAALPRAFFHVVAVCLVMSLLYSVPPVRLKAVAGADWLINMVGFGTLTPYAGWAVTGEPLTAPAAWALAAFCPLFAALYPLTQLYQMDEDRARGDRTLALVVGVRASLVLSLLSTVLAFACLARSATLAGTGAPGWAALGIALAAWIAVLGRWLARHRTMSPAAHKRGMYLALGAWALTDLAVVIAVAR